MEGYVPTNNSLRGLMEVLRKGNPWVEGSYKSPEELALGLRIEAKRTQLERQRAKKKELFNINFEMWYTLLGISNILKIKSNNPFKSLPVAMFDKKMSDSVYRNLMQGYFGDKIMGNG